METIIYDTKINLHPLTLNLIFDRIQSSETSDLSPTHQRKQKFRRKLGYLPMTTITSLDMPTEDELPGTNNQGN